MALSDSDMGTYEMTARGEMNIKVRYTRIVAPWICQQERPAECRNTE